MTFHLNDDQLDDLLLLDDATPETVAHLAACSHCKERFTSVQASLASFNAVSLAWGERRSATLPLLQPSRANLATGGRLRVALGATAAAIFVLALALPLLHHGSATQTMTQTAQQNAAPHAIAPLTTAEPASVATTQSPEIESQPQDPREAQGNQIARDNQLLQAIDHELAASETPANLLKIAGPQDSNQTSPDTTRNN